jgi:acetoin:2,6-dichlorophenolindophenol oxidoreductase subunit beta
MREISFSNAIAEAFIEEMRRDETVFIMGEDVGRFGMSYYGKPEMWKEFGDERVRDTPISENAIVGYALGAAITGMRPVADIKFSNLLPLAAEQIVNQVAMIRYMFGGKIRVPLVIHSFLGGGRSGGAHHSAQLEAWFTHTPGLKVVLPSTPRDAKGLMKAAIREDNPVIFFGHQQLVGITGPVPEEDYVTPFGKADIRREGKDITVVSYSFMVHKVLRAANEVAKQGIETEVIDLRTLSPLDIETILKSVEKTGRLLIVHQACTTGGFGAEIAGIVAEKGFDLLTAPIYRLGAFDVPVPYSPPLEDFVIPNEKRITEKILSIVKN